MLGAQGSMPAADITRTIDAIWQIESAKLIASLAPLLISAAEPASGRAGA
jgi:hypothetical protein